MLSAEHVSLQNRLVQQLIAIRERELNHVLSRHAGRRSHRKLAPTTRARDVRTRERQTQVRRHRHASGAPRGFRHYVAHGAESRGQRRRGRGAADVFHLVARLHFSVAARGPLHVGRRELGAGPRAARALGLHGARLRGRVARRADVDSVARKACARCLDRACATMLKSSPSTQVRRARPNRGRVRDRPRGVRGPNRLRGLHHRPAPRPHGARAASTPSASAPRSVRRRSTVRSPSA